MENHNGTSYETICATEVPTLHISCKEDSAFDISF